MTKRPRLTAVVLTGPREVIRSIAFLVISIAATLAAIGYVLPAHRLKPLPTSHSGLDLAPEDAEVAFHSNLADGGPLPLLVLPLVAVLVLLLMRQRHLGTGILAGILGCGAAFLSILQVLLTHFLSRVELAYGERVFAFSMLVLLFTSVALVLVEPVLYLLERRRIEQAAKPAPLPVATIARA